MRSLKILIALFLLSPGFAKTQQVVWAFLADKGPQAAEMLENPAEWMSAASLQVRLERGLAVDAHDLPLYLPYVAALQQQGIEVLGFSRWLNAAAVKVSPAQLPALQSLPCVKAIRPMHRYATTSVADPELKANERGAILSAKTATTFNYGYAATQNSIINIECMHDAGFTGRGVRVMVCDAGFLRADTMRAFDSLFADNRLLATRDFVTGDSSVFEDYFHGSLVLSNLCANVPGVAVGTAPHIELILARTENINSESHIEEYNWLAAMEWADSMGVQLIHSSIGYAIMDTLATSYSYADMDGDTPIITQAADLAASRGILVVNSAGNEGASQWHYLTAPCDGDSVLCVGAVDSLGVHAPFSSYGPSADGRVKPDVVAMGAEVYVMSPFGIFPMQTNGTSFAAPQVAGLAACLIQAHPSRSNMQIIDAIRMSADHYMMPDSMYGYGIPNACRADSMLTVLDARDEQQMQPRFSLFPNPADGMVRIVRKDAFATTVRVVDLTGRLVKTMPFEKGTTLIQMDVSEWPHGVYFVTVEGAGGGLRLVVE